MAAYNAPVHYTVPSTTPIRIAGSSDPPYRIINLETSGAVWLSDNAGLQAGQGTPCNPGTSLLWVRPGELWAIADAGVNAQIIITTEVEDWQPDPAAIAAAILNSGVLLVDRPVALFTNDTITTTGDVDISRYQSLSIQVVPNAAQRIYIRFKNPDGSTGIVKSLDFNFTGAGWSANIPCYLSTVEIECDLGTFQCTLIASHRPQETIDQQIQNLVLGVDNTALYSAVGFTVNAGSSYTARIAPWYGTVTAEFLISSAAAPGAGSYFRALRDVVGESIANIRATQFALTPITAQHYLAVLSIPVAGERIAFDVHNATAGNWTGCSIRVVPNNGYGGS